MNETPNTLRLISYDITFDPIDTYPRSQELKKDSAKIAELLYSNDYEKALDPLLVLTKKYPDDPTIQGYLASAYFMTNKKKMAKTLVTENYKRFPDYFFARYMYIELCFDECDFETAKKNFDNKFDLHLLYPHRTVFHISEFLGFSKICAQHFYVEGDRSRAELYVNAIKNFDDKHPALKQLEPYSMLCAFKEVINRVDKRASRQKK